MKENKNDSKTKPAEIDGRGDEEKRRQGKTLKVTALSQGECEYVPFVRIAGKWLERFGFKLNDEVVLIATQGQLLIKKKNEERR